MSTALRPLLLLAAFIAVMPAHAQDVPPEPGSQREDAGARVRQVERDGGRVLQAEPMQRSGREVYRLKVLTPEGRVRVLDDSRGRDVRSDRLDSARQSPMLRDRQRVREPAARQEQDADSGDSSRSMPRRGEGGRSGDRSDRN